MTAHGLAFGLLVCSILALAPRTVYGLGIPLSSRQPGQFTEFQGRRVGFGSVKEVRVPLAGATVPELQEYLTPERVATAMWDREKVLPVGDGCYELRMDRLSFVMLDVESSVMVRVARETEQPGVISLNSESFSVAAQSPAGTLSIDELGIFVRVAGQLQILESRAGEVGLAVGGQVGFETEGDLPGLMMLTPRPVVTAAAGGLNRAVMALVVGEFAKGMTADFEAWRRLRDAPPDTPPPAPLAGVAEAAPAPPPRAATVPPAAPVAVGTGAGASYLAEEEEAVGQGGWLL